MSNIKELNQFLILPKVDDPTIVLPFSSYDKLKEVESPLLQAIDDDNVPLVRGCLKRDHISSNQKYVIPPWDIPDAACFCLQPLLHRAIRAGSVGVFKELLVQGADPKAKGYMNTDAITVVFGSWPQDENKVLQMGKALIKTKRVSPADLRDAFAKYGTSGRVRNALNHCMKEMKQVKIKVSPLLSKGKKEHTL